MEEIKVSEMLQAESINKDDSVMIIQEGVNKKASGSIQTATGTSLSLTSVADTCKVTSNSKNLLNETSATYGYYYNDNGVYTAAADTNISEYIDVKANTTYTIRATSDQQPYVRINFFSSSKIWLSQVVFIPSASNQSYTFSIPNESAYVRVSWNIIVTYEVQLEEGSTATDYNPYNTKVLVRTKNLITNIIEGYALSSNTGAIAANPQRAVTDFIDVEPNMEYVRSGYSTTGTVFYDANKNRISNDNSNPFTTPSGTKYVRLGINSTLDYSQAQLEKGSTATSYVKGKNQEISLTPQEEKVAFTYNTETNILSDGSVTIEYNTQSRLLNNDDTTAIKEYVDDIIEEGNNDKGNYIKYRSGIMICTSRTTYTNIVVNTASGGCYSNDANIFIDFPETFISRPVVSLQVTGTTTGWVQTFTATGTPEIRTDGFRIFRTTSRTSSTYYIDMIAIGRWK